MSIISSIEQARNAAQDIRPSGIMAYIDKVQLWFITPLTRAEKQKLRELCGGRCYFKNKHPDWDRKRRYQQRVHLRRPSAEALLFLRQLDGAHLNQLEVALDLIFDTKRELDEAHAFITQFMFKRWHGDQGIRVYKNTRYTGARSAPTNLVLYSDRPSRTTGEVYCVHIEWRLNKVRTLQRAGIKCVGDLLNFDYREFWEKRLLMQAIDLRKLGRDYNVHRLRKGRRRGPWLRVIETGKGQLVHDLDLRTGFVVVRTCGSAKKGTLGSTQAIHDKYRTHFDVSRCRKVIDVTHLLPEST